MKGRTTRAPVFRHSMMRLIGGYYSVQIDIRRVMAKVTSSLRFQIYDIPSLSGADNPSYDGSPGSYGLVDIDKKASAPSGANKSGVTKGRDKSGHK